MIKWIVSRGNWLDSIGQLLMCSYLCWQCQHLSRGMPHQVLISGTSIFNDMDNTTACQTKRFVERKLIQYKKEKFPLRHISNITNVFHIQQGSFQIPPNTFSRKCWVLCIVCKQEPRAPSWMQAVMTSLLQQSQHAPAGKANAQHNPRERKGLLGRENQVDRAVSALSEQCTQAAKLMGPFLVMSAEEVTFVKMEWVA